MSYSITAKGRTKAEAKENTEKQFDELVLAHQPIHARDKAAALANACAMIDLLTDVPEGFEIHVSMSGSVSWSQTSEDINSNPLTGASANCYAFFNKVEQ